MATRLKMRNVLHESVVYQFKILQLIQILSFLAFLCQWNTKWKMHCTNLSHVVSKFEGNTNPVILSVCIAMRQKMIKSLHESVDSKCEINSNPIILSFRISMKHEMINASYESVWCRLKTGPASRESLAHRTKRVVSWKGMPMKRHSGDKLVCSWSMGIKDKRILMHSLKLLSCNFYGKNGWNHLKFAISNRITPKDAEDLALISMKKLYAFFR